MSDLNSLVSQKLDEILSSVEKVSSMYVEPGDVILVTVDKNADQKILGEIKKVMSSIFKDNGGMFINSDVNIQVVKKEELTSLSSPEIESLKEEISNLKKKLESIEQQISVYYMDI